DRASGAMRRLTVDLRLTLSIIAGLFMVPIVIGLGLRMNAMADVQELRDTNAALLVENGSYRAATGELTTQIQSLEGVIDDLGQRATLDPEEAKAIQRLPAVVKSHAVGGVSESNRAIADVISSLSPLSS